MHAWRLNVVTLIQAALLTLVHNHEVGRQVISQSVGRRMGAKDQGRTKDMSANDADELLSRHGP